MNQQNPNEHLAKIIQTELQQKGLIDNTNPNFIQKLANGTMKENDWLNALESKLKTSNLDAK
jgi:hypothetical protein